MTNWQNTWLRVWLLMLRVFEFFAEYRLYEVVQLGVLFFMEYHWSGSRFLFTRGFRIRSFELCVETIFEVFQFCAQFKRFLTLFGCHGREFFICKLTGIYDICCQTFRLTKQLYISEFWSFRRRFFIVTRMYNLYYVYTSRSDKLSVRSFFLLCPKTDVTEISL